MSFEILKSRNSAMIFKKSILFLRPFHVVHQWAIIVLILAVKGIYFQVQAMNVLAIWLMAFLVVPLLFIINDYLHKDLDKEMKLERVFTIASISRRAILSISITIFLTVAVLALLRSIENFIFLLVLLLLASLYGFCKYKLKTTLTYIFRGLSGTALYLFIASYFGLYYFELLVALFVGFADIQAHFVGDIRDIKKDSETKLKTLPLRIGIKWTSIFVALLQIITIAIWFLVAFSFSSDQLISSNLIKSEIHEIPLSTLVACMIMLAFAWPFYLILLGIKSNPDKWLHACFHGSKILNFVLISSLILSFSVLGTFLLLFIFFLSWSIAYFVYLWADDRILFIRDSSIKIN